MSEPLGDPLVAEEPAPLGRRAAAYAVDVAAVGTWMWALSITHIAFWLQWSDDRAVEPWGEWFLVTVTFVAFFVAYVAIFTWKVGATPGQDLMRLHVVDARTGGRIGLGRAFGRALFVGLIWLVPWVWPGVLLALMIGASGWRDPHGRMIHDHLCHTTAVFRLVPELEEGQTIEEAEAVRRRHFMPRMANPIQITPMQMFREHERRQSDGDDED